MTDAVSDGRVDRVLGDIAFDAEVIVATRLLRQPATLLFHLVRGLPRLRDDLANTPHGLAIATHHADGAEIVEDVFGRDRFATDTAFRKSDILRQAWIEMMANHQHVQVFVDGIDRVRAGGIGRTGQDVPGPAD